MKRNSLIMKIIFLALFINLLVYILYGSKALLNSDSAFLSIFPLSNWKQGKYFLLLGLIPMIFGYIL